MMFGYQNPPVKVPNEEDALTFIVRALRDPKENLGNYGYEVYMLRVFDLYLKNVCGFQNHHESERAYDQIAPPFYAAAWELCRRGVLRPGIQTYRGQEAGGWANGYTVLPAGKQWLAEATQDDCLPIEPGRFSKLLDNFASRFGAQAMGSGPRKLFDATARWPTSAAAPCAGRRQNPYCWPWRLPRTATRRRSRNSSHLATVEERSRT